MPLVRPRAVPIVPLAVVGRRPPTDGAAELGLTSENVLFLLLLAALLVMLCRWFAFLDPNGFILLEDDRVVTPLLGAVLLGGALGIRSPRAASYEHNGQAGNSIAQRIGNHTEDWNIEHFGAQNQAKSMRRATIFICCRRHRAL
jgi:hypothetical protein